MNKLSPKLSPSKSPRQKRGIRLLVTMLQIATLLSVLQSLQGCDEVGHGQSEVAKVYAWAEDNSNVNLTQLPTPVKFWLIGVFPPQMASNGAITISTRDPRLQPDSNHFKWYATPPTLLQQVSGINSLLAGYEFTLHTIGKDANGVFIFISAKW